METQLSLLILFEAFKYSITKVDYVSLFRHFFEMEIEFSNYLTLKARATSIAFLNAKGAKFTDAIIFCEPMIGNQEKQSTKAKDRKSVV